MSFLNLAKKRQSCRKYSSQEVSRESITRCLEAARLAPSACNSQPWYFVVVTDPDLKQKVAEMWVHVEAGLYTAAVMGPNI